MSNDAIYLVVWNMKDEKGREGLDYWLSSINSKAPSSQVIVVGTHLDEVKSKVSVEHLKDKYPIIKHFSYVSCIGKDTLTSWISGEGIGINKLRDVITRMAVKLMIEIPKSYMKLAETIAIQVGVNLCNNT